MSELDGRALADFAMEPPCFESSDTFDSKEREDDEVEVLRSDVDEEYWVADRFRNLFNMMMMMNNGN